MKNSSFRRVYRDRFSMMIAGAAVLAAAPLASASESVWMPRDAASATVLEDDASGIANSASPLMVEAPAIAPQFSPATAETKVVLDLLDELMVDMDREIELASADIAPAPQASSLPRNEGASLTGPQGPIIAPDTQSSFIIPLTINGATSDNPLAVRMAGRDGIGENAAIAGIHYNRYESCCLVRTTSGTLNFSYTYGLLGPAVYDIDRTFYIDFTDEGDLEATPYNAEVIIQNTTPAPAVTITGGEFIEGSGIGSVFFSVIGRTAVAPVIENTAPFGTSMGSNDTAMGGFVHFGSRAGDRITLSGESDSFVGSCNDAGGNNCDGLTDADFVWWAPLCAEAGDAPCSVHRFDFELVDNDFADGNKQFEAVFEAVEHATLVNDRAMVVIIDDDSRTSMQEIQPGPGSYLFAFNNGTILEVVFVGLETGGFMQIELLDDFTTPPPGINPLNVLNEYLRITAPDLVGNDPVVIRWIAGSPGSIDLDDVDTAWRVIDNEIVEKLSVDRDGLSVTIPGFDLPLRLEQSGAPLSGHIPITIQGASFSDWYLGQDDPTSVQGWELLEY